jgi:hypothetical protein
MQSIILEPTNFSPHVVFESNGNLSLKGRSLMSDVVSFYQPLIEWTSLLNCQTINFTVEIDYFNTSSSKMLLELLKAIDNNANIQVFDVIWCFDADDEDILEKGQIFEEKLKNALFLFKEFEGV